MHVGNGERSFENEEFLAFLDERDAHFFDQRNQQFRDDNFSTLQLEKISKIIKHLSSPNQFSKDHLYTLQDFKKDIEDIGEAALYCLLGSAGENSINSIISALLQNPSNENLSIFFYLVETYPELEFHRVIDIRHTAFDPQTYLPDAVAQSITPTINQKIDVKEVKQNASKMLNYIDQNASVDDKNKLGLVNLAMLWDDQDLFATLVNDPNIYLKLRGARNSNVLNGVFLNKNRAEIIKTILINEGFNEKELGELNDKILIQILGTLDPAFVPGIIDAMANNFPSFSNAALKALAFDFTAIASLPEAPGNLTVALKKIVRNYQDILSCCKGAQLEFRKFFTERNVIALTQQLLNLPTALEAFGIDVNLSKSAMLSVLELMFLYQPQLIDALPLSNGLLSSHQRDAMFFGMLMKEGDMEFLDNICNAHVTEYVQDFLQKTPEECKKILRNAGVSNNRQFTELCVKIMVVGGVTTSKEFNSLDFEVKRGWLTRAPKVEKPVSIAHLLQSENHIDYFIGGIARSIGVEDEKVQQSTKFVDIVRESQNSQAHGRT
ncbi:MAG: hypothetical protein ACK5V4_04825 [Alphaproteobacteria bacterium]